MTNTQAPPVLVGHQQHNAAGVRFFQVNGETVRGDSGQHDTESFASGLTRLQTFAQKLGAQFGMQSICHGMVASSGQTLAFEFADADQHDGEAELRGLMADRRLNSSEALTRIHRHAG